MLIFYKDGVALYFKENICANLVGLYYLSAVIDILRTSVLHPDWATLLVKHVEAENGIQVKDEHQLCLISENAPCKWFNCF